MARSDLEALRASLAPLVESFELDEPERGLIAWIPVVGGKFIHPLTRERVERIRVYGAGADRIKIQEPAFLRSLPVMSIAGITDAASLCALIARTLSETLAKLARLRKALAPLGITMDLERDILRLRGAIEVEQVEVEVTAVRPGQLVLSGLGGRSLGALDPALRSFALSGDPARDRAALTASVRGLLAREEQPSPVLELVEEAIVEPMSPAESASIVEAIPETDPASIVEAIPEAEPAPIVEAIPEAEPAPIVVGALVSAPDQPAIEDDPTATALEQVATLDAAKSGSPMKLGPLLEAMGREAEVSASQNNLRFAVPYRSLQGVYTFYLEQTGGKHFEGLLVSPRGQRYPVEVDFGTVLDLKEVFDKMILGR